MDVMALVADIARPCSELAAGGFRPSGDRTESWLGQVTLFAPSEAVPTGSNGEPMQPLAQLHLPTLGNTADQLVGVELLTVFYDGRLDPTAIEGSFVVREYRDASKLQRRELPERTGSLKPFPLRHQPAVDHPLWDNGGLTGDQAQAIMAFEDEGTIDDYWSVAPHVFAHKVGGYPSFCQSGVDLSPHEFVFQIASDAKIGLNVVDGGTLTFWRNPTDASWRMYFDFY